MKIFNASNNKVILSSDGRVDKIIIDLSKSKKLKNNQYKNSIYIENIKAIKNLFF